MSRKKHVITIRWRLLLFVIPLTIIPVLLVTLFSMTKLFSYLKQKNSTYYQLIVKQVANNIDFVYEQYARTFYNMSKIPSLVDGLSAPPYRSKTEESAVGKKITGYSTSQYGLRKSLEEKVEGSCFVYELDRESLLDKTPYKIHRIFEANFETFPRFEKMLDDPLYTTIQNDSSTKMIFGKFEEGVLSGKSDKTPAFIYPLMMDSKGVSFTKFMVILMFPSFIKSFYQDVDDIQFGTIYIIDRFNSIIAVNHPDSDDYYEYDTDTHKYKLGDDEVNDPYEHLSFKDYGMLNTDASILADPELAPFFNQIKSNETIQQDSPLTIKYKNQRFLVVTDYCPFSRVRLIFFLPLYHVYGPLFVILFSILTFTIILTIVLFIITIFFSRMFTHPIEILSENSRQISKGNYKIDVNMDNFFGEFLLLGNSFKDMADKINSYNENLENLVNIRTRDLNNANKELTKLNRQMSEFLAYVTHELRTPLTSIIGFAKLINIKLRDNLLPHVTTVGKDPVVKKIAGKMTEFVSVIVSEGDRLTSLINNFLDLTKIESGKMEWHQDKTSIQEIIEQSLMITCSFINQPNLEIKSQIESDLPAIICDYHRLIQVMVNLISNAVKFTENGVISISATKDNKIIKVGVSDTGKGIAEENIEKIFDKFQQVSGHKGKLKGSGLGLPICKQIVEYYNGTIWIESVIDKGSTFYFTLPLASVMRNEQDE